MRRRINARVVQSPTGVLKAGVRIVTLPIQSRNPISRLRVVDVMKNAKANQYLRIMRFVLLVCLA